MRSKCRSCSVFKETIFKKEEIWLMDRAICHYKHEKARKSAFTKEFKKNLKSFQHLLKFPLRIKYHPHFLNRLLKRENFLLSHMFLIYKRVLEHKNSKK